jgi:RNA polymerase sigma-70 factor (ECF subfamily)
LWTIFKNNFKDWFKKKDFIYFWDIKASNEDREVENFFDNKQDNIIDILEQDFKLERIKKALQKLPDKYKDVIFLKYVEWKTNEEIMEILNISYDTLRQRLSRWLKKLKQII